MIARCQMTPQEVKDIRHHTGWDDGREGFVWCRFDALLMDSAPFVRAEITWDDDNETGEPTSYFDPILLLETNTDVGQMELRTIDQIEIKIEREELYSLLMNDPKEILTKYAEAITKLRKQ